MNTQIQISQDIPISLAALILGALALGLGRHCFVSWQRHSPWRLVLCGILANCALACALLRPVLLVRRGLAIGPRIAILVDASRRLGLMDGEQDRASRAVDAVGKLLKRFGSARVDIAAFGEGSANILDGVAHLPQSLRKSESSDLSSALTTLVESIGERPAALVVVSDGRFNQPDQISDFASQLPVSLKGVPVHAVNVASTQLPDASIRSINAIGQAVAHQVFSLRVEIACSGGLKCRQVQVQVQELERGVQTRDLARSAADLSGKSSSVVDFNLEFERAGSHALKVALTHQRGDEVPENDQRYLLFNVVRDRIRLLHIAGAPSYDVRELRRWLKGNASVDLVSFFILRSDEDDPNTSDSPGELSLIPFPVDELFTQHLPSFDAVILQDIDAAKYHLDVYLDRLARYVEEGGGLILVGGASAFSSGAYIHSALERVLPVALVVSHNPFDTIEFVPSTTAIGQQAPILAPLRRLVGDRLPQFPGANTLGPPRDDARTLWVHPQRSFLPIRGQTMAGGPMPVLSIRDVNDGRTVALGLDSTYRLAWGTLAAETAGRAYSALWEALLGWVMHESRFEPFRGELQGVCIHNSAANVRWVVPVGTRGRLRIEVEGLGTKGGPAFVLEREIDGTSTIDTQLNPLPEGAYAAMAQISGGMTTRLDFACEKGGTALADSRPDALRLSRLATSTRGDAVVPDEIERLPIPRGLFVDQVRTSKSIAPQWLWSLVAAVSFGITWLQARNAGLH